MDIENLNPAASTVIENNTNDVVLDKDVEKGAGVVQVMVTERSTKTKKFVFN